MLKPAENYIKIATIETVIKNGVMGGYQINYYGNFIFNYPIYDKIVK